VKLMTTRSRPSNALRPIKFSSGINKNAFSSVLVEFGDTKVLTCVSYEGKVPPFLRNTGSGWLTAEYAMLPAATSSRTRREVTLGKPSGRTSEIQRLIGRSLRAAIDLKQLGELTLTIDCDVLVADGGTRTASISGAYVALEIAIKKLIKMGVLKTSPIQRQITAISIGLSNNGLLLDLDYADDSSADVDLNIVMDQNLNLIEIQGTAEKNVFTTDQLMQMLALASEGIKDIASKQRDFIDHYES
jgi:ribonuclease PH